MASGVPPRAKTSRPKLKYTGPSGISQESPKAATWTNPPSSASQQPRARIRFFPSRIAAVIFGGIALVSGFYVFSLAKSISILSSESRCVDIDVDAPTAETYDHIAPYFDSQVQSTEFWLGISKLRRQLVGQAAGHVLEVGVGTGRNHAEYDLKKCRSITMVDASENMIAVASVKWSARRLLPEWRETAPDGARRVNFRIVDAAAPAATADLAPPRLSGHEAPTGFDTIVSTFTLCSIPRPADALARLCTLLADQPSSLSSREAGREEQQPRVLLLEHGASNHVWLNRLLRASAPAHAAKHGCWWDRDVGAIAHEAARRAGMEVVEVRRRHFGTTWIVEMRPAPGVWSRRRVEEERSPIDADRDGEAQKSRARGWWDFWS